MRYWPVLSLLLLALCGCGEQPAAKAPVADATPNPPPVLEAPEGLSEPVLEPTAPDAKATEPVVAGASDLRIEILDWDQTQAIVKAHPGQVVVLDLWATYCPPCLKELPGLVELQAKHPEVVCVSVALDYDGDAKTPPSTFEPEIRRVLEKIKAGQLRNVLLSTSSEDVFKRIEHQSMPVIYVFDQTGQRVAMFPDLKVSGETTYAQDVVPVVEKLLAAPKP